MVFEGGTLGSMQKIQGNPYLNSMTALFDTNYTAYQVETFQMKYTQWDDATHHPVWKSLD